MTRWGTGVARCPWKGKKSQPVGVAVLPLLGNAACHHIELCPSPEERPAYANDAAIAYVRATIVSFRLCKNVDGCLFGKQSQV
jgi:hypothetical protein